MSDADFTKLRNETGAIFEGAVGFAALQQGPRHHRRTCGTR